MSPNSPIECPRHYLFASDFDQTLSFNDSGAELAKLVGIADFDERVAKLAQRNLVQQGAELTYLLLHDPDFRGVRKSHLAEAGKKVRVKQHVRLLGDLLARGLDGFTFDFYVISAAPQEVVESALAGIVPPERIIGTQLVFDARTEEVRGVSRVPAGYGKVACLQHLQAKLQVADERVIYAGDGQSDIHVMLHINQRQGYTLAVSDAEQVTRIACRTVLSDDATSVLIPVLEDVCGWPAARIRALFERAGITIWGWAKMRTDVVSMGARSPQERLGA
jgi:phosphoserine phosphatase